MNVSSVQQGLVTFGAEDFDFTKFQTSLNYPPSNAPPEPIYDFLERHLFPMLPELPVRYQYRLSAIDTRDVNRHRLQLLPQAHLAGPMVYRLLRHSDQLIALLISINYEQTYDVWEDYIAYTFYNTILHQALDTVRRQIITDLKIPEFRLTRRYAPGYCGWPIADQKTLLSLLKPLDLGVTLSDSYVLFPNHTITGIFGLRRHDRLRERMPCYTCTSVSCRVHYDFQNEPAVITRIEHA